MDGGGATLLGAIQDVAGPAATLVVPAQTAWNSLTSRAFRAATAGLDPDGYARYVAAMPGFDPGDHALDRNGGVRRACSDAS